MRLPDPPRGAQPEVQRWMADVARQMQIEIERLGRTNQLAVYATGALSPATQRTWAIWTDGTVTEPIWSDGTTWRNTSGTART